jgi:hypothetical protein
LRASHSTAGNFRYDHSGGYGHSRSLALAGGRRWEAFDRSQASFPYRRGFGEDEMCHGSVADPDMYIEYGTVYA